ncbi:hypothetical protein [Alicyclobacillus dauci]|uniref:Amidohydrolase n=1 Tax=Alicyclobacillus dauci TaxID=1475485 RepID=A0ABY6Z9Q4_9BACL|nr:hypothetical protein [Alicyclobacillus dauci]WAH39273.1 hypothetical protein NZD86_18850 [Alicyclobacillus dauci]WAH39471.1 hypothetical protein NZD86_23170 [Alicyclobacillus dauci]
MSKAETVPLLGVVEYGKKSRAAACISWIPQEMTWCDSGMLSLDAQIVCITTGRVSRCHVQISYAEVHDLLAELLPKSLTSTDLADIFGENCVRFYRIDVDTAFEG